MLSTRLRLHFAGIVVLVFSLFLLAGCQSAPSSPSNKRVNVSGALTRDLSKAEVFYEGDSDSRHVFLQEFGPGKNAHVLEFSVPNSLKPGTYKISPRGPIQASYNDVDKDGVSRTFNTNQRGTLTITEAGQTFRGELDFTVEAVSVKGKVEKITIDAAFDGLPFIKLPDIGPDGKPIAPAAPPASGLPAGKTPGTAASGSAMGILSAVLLAWLMILTAISLLFQVHVGRQVYAGQSLMWLRMSNPTRVYLRGWRDPRLRSVMGLWSALIILFVVSLCLLAVLSS